MGARPFRQVDVFSPVPFAGNPVAVVLDADGLDDHAMQTFARWTNLSETTFVHTPTMAGADYRVRIFTPTGELPFAGHPTLGTCHAWLEQHPGAHLRDRPVLQQCPMGLVPIRTTPDGLAFAAPPLLRDGPVERDLLTRITAMLGIQPADVVAAEHADNGPGWVAILLPSADAVLALRPSAVDVPVGVVGPYPQGSAAAFELRAFLPRNAALMEDPVTGSLNAAVAQWLLRTGRARSPYLASQGTALHRSGRVHIHRDDDGAIWVGGATITRLSGTAIF